MSLVFALECPQSKSSRNNTKPESLTFSKASCVVKTSVKIARSLGHSKSNSTTNLSFKPFHSSKTNVARDSLITEDHLEKSVNFNDPSDQKLITDVLLVRPNRRHDEEILYLQKAFKDIEFFKQAQGHMDENYYKQLFQGLQLDFVKAGKKVFNHGDIGKTFYIIIRGSVYILPKSEGLVSGEESDDIESTKQSSNEEIEKLRENLKGCLQTETSESLRRKMVERCYPGCWVLEEKGKGACFGELALIKTGNRLRTATVVCKEDTVFGTLSYTDYQAILGGLHEKKFAENLALLTKIDIFKHWKENQISSVLLSCNEKRLARNNVIFREGDLPNFVYFIKKGEVELQKFVDPDQKDFTSASKSNRSSNLSSASKVLQKRRHLESIRLGILTVGDYFGEELFEADSRDYTAVVYSSEVSVVLIPRDTFLRLIRDKISLAALESHIQRKKEWRDKLIANHFTIRSSSSDKTTTFSTPRSSFKIINEEGNVNGFEVVDKNSFPALMPQRNSFQREALHEDRIILKSSSNAMRNTKSSFADDNNHKTSPRVWLTEQSPKLQKKENPRNLMSPVFSFASFKKGSGLNPIYDKQMDKLKRKLKEDQKEENLSKVKGSGIEIKLLPLNSDSVPKESILFAKTSRDLRGFVSSRQNTEEKPNDQGSSIKPRRETKTQSLIEGKPMLKLFKSLGLDKMYLETECTPISLSPETTRFINSPSSSMNDPVASYSLTSRFNPRASDQGQGLRPFLTENSSIYYNGARMSETQNIRGSKLNLFYRNSKNFTAEDLEL